MHTSCVHDVSGTVGRVRVLYHMHALVAVWSKSEQLIWVWFNSAELIGFTRTVCRRSSGELPGLRSSAKRVRGDADPCWACLHKRSSVAERALIVIIAARSLVLAVSS